MEADSLETESSISYGNLIEHSISLILAGFKLAIMLFPLCNGSVPHLFPPRELAVVNW
jgi:hypothetical protein